MEIKTKFDIGERVHYFSKKIEKFRVGEITSINLMVLKGNVIETYEIRAEGADEFSMPEYSAPSMIFKERDDAFDFCNELMQGV